MSRTRSRSPNINLKNMLYFSKKAFPKKTLLTTKNNTEAEKPTGGDCALLRLRKITMLIAYEMRV